VGGSAAAGVARLTLPKGPIGVEAARQLEVEVVALAATPGLRVLLLLPGGPDFCRGLAAGFEPLGCGSDPVAALARVRAPVVAALRGEVASVGLEIALAADLLVLADDAVLSFPDLGAGRLPCWGGTQALVDAVGLALATRMLLGGERLDAAGAAGAGLVHRLVGAAELEGAAAELADHLAGIAPLALASAKEAVRAGARLPMVDALRLEADLSVLLQTTADRREGLDAFLSRREPSFGGD
jgi:enoyl-CoA hydratase/carnithine racemase